MPEWKKATIFVVDDNAFFRVGLREILKSEGYTVIEAQDGRDALRKMRDTTPELIISDINMPHMDGYAFFQEVHANPQWVGIPFIFLSAYDSPEDVVAGKKLGVEDYLTKPIDYNELVSIVQAKLTRFRELRMVQLQQAYEASLTMLANAIEVRDSYTRGHVERVTAYALAIARVLGWSEADLNTLRLGAILHDIGKIQIRDEILRKKGALTPEERREMRTHPVVGAKMVERIPFLTACVPIILSHHERWDGSGYPHGLAGKDIPVGARLLSIADSFDAITTTRSYREARALETGKTEIIRSSGTMYDPKMVEAFLEAWKQGEIHRIAATWGRKE